jgi:inner membrane protein
VGREWGGSQTFGGPVLTIPFQHAWRDQNGIVHERVERLFMLPESLQIEGSVDPEFRRRGIFEVVVYTARLKMSGRFPRPDFASIRPSPATIDWSNATVDIGISDPRGIARRIEVDLNGRKVVARPGVTANGLFSAGVRAAAEGLSAESQPLSFALDLELKGTEKMLFVPSGDETTLRLGSRWPHPSFFGAPQESAIDANGFTATWRVPYFGRGFASRWTGEDMKPEQRHNQAAASLFGVTLIRPVNIYVQTERAVKYAALFVVLTFVIAFLWEVSGRALVHPVQYAFVGFAMCIFYLLLLSLSEHIGFDRAYAAAASATIGLVTWYWSWIVRGFAQGTLMGAALVTLYGFLFLLLRLEDYALLAGSVGLFVMLALLMFFTRRVNWYALTLAEPRG